MHKETLKFSRQVKALVVYSLWKKIPQPQNGNIQPTGSVAFVELTCLTQ